MFLLNCETINRYVITTSINKIGKVDKREISHSNTFSIPYIFHNTDALGLNIFNVHKLAVSLNQKYAAKYYKEGILLQTRFCSN